MPHQLGYVNYNQLKASIMSKRWLSDFGSYNRMPEPFEPIQECKFSDIAKRGLPEYVEYRMIETPDVDKKYFPLYIYWYDDGGLGILFDYNSRDVSYFFIGCIHDFDEKVDDKGRHDLTCKICGYQDVIYDEDETAK